MSIMNRGNLYLTKPNKALPKALKKIFWYQNCRIKIFLKKKAVEKIINRILKNEIPKLFAQKYLGCRCCEIKIQCKNASSKL